jgi:hypothetical protein
VPRLPVELEHDKDFDVWFATKHMRNSLQGVIAKFREVCPWSCPPRAPPTVGTCCKRSASTHKCCASAIYILLHNNTYICVRSSI